MGTPFLKVYEAFLAKITADEWTVEEEIANQLVDEVLFGSLEKGGKVTVDFKKENLIFTYGKESS